MSKNQKKNQTKSKGAKRFAVASGLVGFSAGLPVLMAAATGFGSDTAWAMPVVLLSVLGAATGGGIAADA